MNLWKKHLSKLFLAYFLLYILSPLCYMGNQSNENTAIAPKTKHNTRNIRVIWELVFLKIFQQESTDDNHSNVRFIIKKARAVLRSNSPLKLAHSEFISSIQNDFIPFLEPLSILIQFIRLASQKGFYISFSGLSPPSV